MTRIWSSVVATKRSSACGSNSSTPAPSAGSTSATWSTNPSRTSWMENAPTSVLANSASTADSWSWGASGKGPRR